MRIRATWRRITMATRCSSRATPGTSSIPPTPGPTGDSRPPRGNWADPVTERSRQVHDRHRITDCPAASATAEFAHDRYRYRRRKPARPDAPEPAHRLDRAVGLHAFQIGRAHV